MQNKLLLLLTLTTALLAACAPADSVPQSDSTAAVAKGAVASSPSQLITVSAPDVNAAEPAIAAALDGTVFVAWVEHLENAADLMIRHYDADGQPKGDAVRINPLPGNVKTWYGDPPTVKIARDGIIYVGWTAKVEGAKGAANVLYLSASRNGGGSFDAPVKVNDDAIPAAHGMHSLAIDSSGRIYVAWLDERYLNSHQDRAALNDQSGANFQYEKAAFFHHTPEPKIEAKTAKENKEGVEPNAELYFAVSADRGKTFSPNKRLASNVCPCCKTSLLAAEDNRLYVSWRQVLSGDFRHIAVASSTDGGNSFSAPVIISDDRWQIAACPVSGAALAEDSGKKLQVSWYTAGEAGKPGIYLSESNDGGKTFLPRELISENAISGTPGLIAEKNKTSKIAWTEADQVIMATFTKQNKVLENKQQMTTGKLPVMVGSGEQVFISFVEKTNEINNIKLIITK